MPSELYKSGLSQWIDAACINQENVLERSAQVQLTSRILATATMVYLWLREGVSEELDHAAFDVLSCLRSTDEHEQMLRTSNEEGKSVNICALGRTEEWATKLDQYSEGCKNRLMSGFGFVAYALHRIVDRSLFARRWVAQELSFPQSPPFC